MFLASMDPIEEVVPHELLRLGPLHITSVMVMATVAAPAYALDIPAALRPPRR